MPSHAASAVTAALLALAALSLASCGGEEPARRPNILVVLADDLAPGALGFEGSPDARTPSLDRLASEGVRFRRAYVPLPQCTPSRASLITGLYPHATGALTNHSTWRRGPTTIAEALGAAGYRCGLVGKWHLGEPDRPEAGFEESWCVIDTKKLSYFDPVLYRGSTPEKRAGYVPTVLTDEAIRFMDDADGRPFFLLLAYTSPHEPLTPPPDPALARKPGDMSEPPAMADDLASKPRVQRESAAHAEFLERSPQEVRYLSALYQSMVDALDVEVGRLLAHLDERGLADDTLVVFLSDNGTLRGEHRMLGKGPAFYEELVRTPLVLRWPGVLPSGGVVEGLASSLDLYPTLARVAGADAPQGLHGLDVWPLALGEERRVRDELFLQYVQRQPEETPTPLLGIVTERAKYVQCFDGDEELYDLERDPHELANRAADPAARAELAELRRRLDAFRESSGLRGR